MRSGRALAGLGLAVVVFGGGYYVASHRARGDVPVESTSPVASAASEAAPPAGPPRSARISPALAPPHHAPDRALAADLRDGDPRVRATAMREYVKGGEAEASVLVEAVRDRDLGVAILATDALGRQHAAGAYDGAALIAAATDHGLPEKVRVSAMNGLGVVASREAARVLVQLLASADLVDRRSAAILLQHQDASLAIEPLIGALGDADAVVAANAHDSLRALARGRDFGNDAAAWRAWWATRR